MGRFTIFSSENCPQCERIKEAFDFYEIPYLDINLSLYPERKNDMMKLSDRMTVPQVFMNETYIGGTDETIQLFQRWEHSATSNSNPTVVMNTPKQQYELLVRNKPDPKDPRLQPSIGPPSGVGMGIMIMTSTKTMTLAGLPSSSSPTLSSPPSPKPFSATTAKFSSLVFEESPPPLRNKQHVIELPNEPRCMTILEMTELLKSVLPCRELKYNLTSYKNAFRASELIDVLQGVFNLKQRRSDALEFGRDVLQKQHKLFGHVVDDHLLKDTPALFFRLTCHQTPNILNSYRPSWTERVDPDPIRLVRMLKNQLTEILTQSQYTDSMGKMNYKKAASDPSLPTFEEAICELHGVDLGTMKDNIKLAFCINVYNLMMRYAFIKVGIPTTDAARLSFFNDLKIRIGPHLFSFNDLEHGILRRNKKAPSQFNNNHSSVQFSSPSDVRKALMVMPTTTMTLMAPLDICGNSSGNGVDCRIHFALNYAGSASSPPIRFFTAKHIDEELNLVARSFCTENIKIISIADDNPASNEVHLSKLFSWYLDDFGGTNMDLLKTIIKFLSPSSSSTGGSSTNINTPRRANNTQIMLQNIIDSGINEPKIKYVPFDWTPNDAIDYIPYTPQQVKTESSRFIHNNK